MIAACARAKLRIVARDERDGGASPGAEPRPHGWPRDRDGDGLRALPPRRGGRSWDCSPRCGCRASTRCARRCGPCSLDHGLPTPLDGTDPDAVVMATARDKKRVGEGPVPFVLLDAPGAARPGCAVAAARADRRRARVVAGVTDAPAPNYTNRSDARREPRPARSPRPAPLRELTLERARAPDLRHRGRAWAPDAVLPDQPRGRVRRAPPPPRGPGRRNRPQPGALDPLLLRDPRRARVDRPAGRRGPPVRRRHARAVAPQFGDPRAVHRSRRRQGARRATATRSQR